MATSTTKHLHNLLLKIKNKKIYFSNPIYYNYTLITIKENIYNGTI